MPRGLLASITPEIEWRPRTRLAGDQVADIGGEVISPQDVVYLSLAVTSLQINHLDQLFR